MRKVTKHITHIISGLGIGGAQIMLYKLLLFDDKPRFQANVISLTDIGPIGQRIQALGVPVMALGMRRGVPDPIAVVRLAIWLRQRRPELIQTWMYHADLVGGIAAWLVGAIPVVWNIRHSDLDPSSNKRTTIWTANVCAKVSRWLPTSIICCSEASKRVHRELGYSAQKMVVIPNGFDLSRFRPDPTARLEVRSELKLPPETVLIGLIARFNVQKDHGNFVNAVASFHSCKPDVHFLLCGDGIKWENLELADRIRDAGMQHSFHLLGRREDINKIMASLDIATLSSSFGEGFPNVIGEAMACGVPCVVTDVGDSAYIVGDTGIVVPPKDPEALAQAWGKLLLLARQDRCQLGERARQRIKENFDIHLIVRRYEELYESVLRG